MSDLLDYATNEQGYKSVTKALKETGPETLDRIVRRLCEPAKGYEYYDWLCITTILILSKWTQSDDRRLGVVYHR